jgi:hypothetical protein
MARLYQLTFHGMTFTNSCDLVSLVTLVTSTAANVTDVQVVRWWMGSSDNTLNTAQMLNGQLVFLPATVTIGSGGSAATPAKTDQGDIAAKCTARVGDTTVATTSGTAVTLDEQTFHLYNGYDSAVQGLGPFAISKSITAAGTTVCWRVNSTAVQGTPKASGGLTFTEAGLGA